MTVSAAILCPAVFINDVMSKAGIRGGNGSAGRASDGKAKRNTDAGSSPKCSKGFFSQSASSADSLMMSVQHPVCNHIHQHLCAC